MEWITGTYGFFPFLAITAWLGVPAYAALARGRLYATFAGVMLTLSIPAALVLHARLRTLAPEGLSWVLDFLFIYSVAAAAVQLVHLVHARMRSTFFRAFVSVPGQTFIAGALLAGPWLLILLPLRLFFGFIEAPRTLEFWTLLEAVPLVIAVLSILTSYRARPETVRFVLSNQGPEIISRVPVERFRGDANAPAGRGLEIPPLPTRPLRLVQLTDTHLGPWQSVDRLRDLIAELVAREPDLIALTGDFLTMESMGSPGCLEQALAPLAPVADRCVAIFGNHDHEAPDQIRHAMRVLGIPLLIDAEACFETPVGSVQIVGSDFVSRDHDAHLGGLLSKFPRRPDHLRLLLLHDPVGFHSLPKDDVDLVLSGHTHGGHVGLVSLGFDWTALTPTRWPDHGLFAKGRSRLYVHRGTGFYGFPLRVGVPSEHSLLEITWP